LPIPAGVTREPPAGLPPRSLKEKETAKPTRWQLTGTRGTSHRGTEPILLAWENGAPDGPQTFVDEWRRLCDHYAGGTFFVASGQPLRTCADPAADPIISFVIAVNWLPIWVDEVSWEPAPPAELEHWQPKSRNVLPLAMARVARRTSP
jgi:hypothetical protein